VAWFVGSFAHVLYHPGVRVHVSYGGVVVTAYRIIRAVLAGLALTGLTLAAAWHFLVFRMQCETRLQNEAAWARYAVVRKAADDRYAAEQGETQ